VSLPADAVDLAAALDAGDVEQTSAALRQVSERGRIGLREAVNERLTAVNGDHGGQPAVALAYLGVQRAVDVFFWAGHLAAIATVPSPTIAEVLKRRDARFKSTLSEKLAREGTSEAWPLLRALDRAGATPEPPRADYLRLLAAGIAPQLQTDDVAAALRADPELLRGDVFELVRSGAIVAAGPDARSAWNDALVALGTSGDVDRDRLLDACVDGCADARSIDQARWCRSVHARLEPTADERRARISAYLPLVASPQRVPAELGLAGLRPVHADVPPDQLARTLPNVLRLGHHTVVVETLALADDVLARGAGSGRVALLRAVGEALGAERVDHQELALAILERRAGNGLPRSVRSELEPLVEVVASALSDRVAVLAGVVPAREPETQENRESAAALDDRVQELPASARASVAPAVAAARDGVWPKPFRPELTVDRLRRSVPLVAPVGDAAELVTVLGRALGGAGEPEDVERVLEGVLRLCQRRPPERRVDALRKRASRQIDDVPELGVDIRTDIAVVALAWFDGRRPIERGPRRGIAGVLARRILEIARRVADGEPAPLVSLPTHRGGFIDPDVLAQRLAAAAEVGGALSPEDVVLARARATLYVPPRPVRERVDQGGLRAALLADDSPPRLRLRLDDGELRHRTEPFCAALDSLGQGPPRWWWPWRPEPISLGYEDPLGARYALIAVPALVQVVYARAGELLALEVDDAAPVTHGAALLERARDPLAPLEAPATKALALGLLARAASVQTVAGSVVAAATTDGRLDGDALGVELAAVQARGFGSIANAAAPLRELAQRSDLHAATAWRILDGFIGASDALQPALQLAPLELYYELSAGLGVGPPAATRANLERAAGDVDGKSRAGRVIAAILKIEAADSPRYLAARLAAADGVVARVADSIGQGKRRRRAAG